VRLSFDANYAANRQLASGGVQPNLNGGLIKDMVLSLPPSEEQHRIVAEVERQFSFIDALLLQRIRLERVKTGNKPTAAKAKPQRRTASRD